MDLFISYRKDFAIIIENKIYAREQDNQLEDYYIKKKDNYKNLYIIFLTPSGYESSTLSEKSKKELENNYQTLKHSDIALWLESILENKKYSFLHEKNILFKDNDNKYIRDYRLLKSAMIQTIHNANMLSNNTKELDMTKGKIQELLKEHLFQDIQTVEDVEEYKKIFNSVNELLDEKKIEIMININWQFTQKVVNYFEDNKIDYYQSLSYIEYKNKYLNNEYVWSIKLGDINNFCIVIESNYSDAYIGFGILTTSDRIRNNIENNKLFTSINNIFSRLEKKNNHGNWVYHTDIFLEKDSPEEIAEAMIKLYNLLKENL
ncbi:PD-(D/E)XK nuclease family protein [Brachyspira pilosicoli]|uniref:PD-(D/E)XK nuclease family protein n=1 Tax=Brachyspira pilosicoli TaxID=52584 RepID=UPI000E17B6AB|nr:PD-(D/E)XK nuclease family protein [Brachyspira pilosicoli]SUW04179.1 Uncharacterised protein [Brachyspira pilosicoli]